MAAGVGSGWSVDAAGDAALRVALMGMGYPDAAATRSRDTSLEQPLETHVLEVGLRRRPGPVMRQRICEVKRSWDLEDTNFRGPGNTLEHEHA